MGANRCEIGIWVQSLHRMMQTDRSRPTDARALDQICPDKYLPYSYLRFLSVARDRTPFLQPHVHRYSVAIASCWDWCWWQLVACPREAYRYRLDAGGSPVQPRGCHDRVKLHQSAAILPHHDRILHRSRQEMAAHLALLLGQPGSSTTWVAASWCTVDKPLGTLPCSLDRRLRDPTYLEPAMH